MPTGYTVDVGDGKVTDFRTFALRCARQFGACVMQRDDPMDEAPKERIPTTYHVEALAKAEFRLAELEAMAPQEASAAAKADYEKRRADHTSYAAKRTETRRRYEAMLAQVEVWHAPTADHRGLRDFMAEQLRQSIDFDCKDYGGAPERKDGATWLAEQKAMAVRDIRYHTDEDEKERQRCAASNEWIRTLMASL